jgi:hypothetical protein
LKSPKDDVPETINLLDLAPQRVAEWQELDDGRVVIKRPKPSASGWAAVKEWLAYWLSTPRLRLDQTGSFTWSRMDGATTVGEIAEAIRRELGDSSQTEERLGVFIRYLHNEGMIRYSGLTE